MFIQKEARETATKYWRLLIKQSFNLDSTSFLQSPPLFFFVSLSVFSSKTRMNLSANGLCVRGNRSYCFSARDAAIEIENHLFFQYIWLNGETTRRWKSVRRREDGKTNAMGGVSFPRKKIRRGGLSWNEILFSYLVCSAWQFKWMSDERAGVIASKQRKNVLGNKKMCSSVWLLRLSLKNGRTKRVLFSRLKA